MRRRSAKIRLLAVIGVVLVAFLLTGCGAKLAVYEYSSDGVRYNMYELTIDADTVENMERTAATDNGGNKYTVEGYFYKLFTDFGYALADAERTDKAYTVRYVKAVGAVSELDEAGTKTDFTRTESSNPFIHTYTDVSPNPFNGVRESYDNVEPDRSQTVLERIKNGAVAFDEFGVRVVSFPALTDAFPYLRGADAGGLPLEYVRYGSARTDSTGTIVDTGGNTAAFVFSRYFDDTETTIDFTFTRAEPYGWYLVAIVAGGLTVAVIFAITRPKKQKPTLLDKFPYNPEQYRDYDSHLPM